MAKNKIKCQTCKNRVGEDWAKVNDEMQKLIIDDKTKSPQESDFLIGKVWEVKLNKEKLVLELNKMRVRMTRIYVELGNPNDCYADMRLRDEIEIFKKKVL